MPIQINGTTGISGVDGSAGTPAIQGTDTNTGISFPAADTVAISTNGSQRLTVDSTGRVGIGTTSPAVLFHLSSTSTGTTANSNVIATIRSQAAGRDANIQIGDGTDFAYLGALSGNLYFSTANTERARIDSSGRLLVGTSTAVGTSNGTGLIVRSPVSNNHPGEILLQNAYTRPGNGSAVGSVKFQDAEGSTYAQIIGFQDGTASSSSDVPGGLTLSTTPDSGSSPVERLRITSSGEIGIGTGGGFGYKVNIIHDGSGLLVIDTNTGNGGSRNLSTWRTGTYSTADSTSLFMLFQRGDGTAVGGIYRNGTNAVTYATSSDYRLKENVAPATDSIVRLQQLKPSRFNFIADPSKTVDGFIAHEVQSVVPEAVTGEKDAVDEDGNPVYQGIDQSKLVPLLTAALQEAIAKIETLEARLTALEAA